MILKIKKYVICLSIIVLALIFRINNFTYAQDSETPTPTPTSDNQVHVDGCPYQNLSKCIQFFQEKVSELNKTGKTLSSQIAVMSNQIQLTEARIKATKQEIADLILDIDTTTKKISHLQESLNKLTAILLNRIVATYESSRVQPFEILLSSDNFSNFFSRLSYLKIAQTHDKKLIYDTQAAKNDYANQKEIFENKKKKVEALKNQLEAYTNQLAQEKKDREALLEVTQNSEAVYQQKLQAALAEQKAIESIVAGGGNAVSVGQIKEGDVIGHTIVGKSACSSGTHLHFEVHKDNNLSDPTSFLNNKSVTFDNSPDSQFGFSGSWNWPISDPIKIEQGFGMTYWARIGWYGGGPHTGIDMFSESSFDIHAVKDGELFRGGISCGGGQLLFARVDQSDSIQTYYLHIVP